MALCKFCNYRQAAEEFETCDYCWELQVSYRLLRPIIPGCTKEEATCQCALHRGRRFFTGQLFMQP